jgi:hypothetical protein
MSAEAILQASYERPSSTRDMTTETNRQVTIPWYLNSVIIPVTMW